jgi:hypothetical protein
LLELCTNELRGYHKIQNKKLCFLLASLITRINIDQYNNHCESFMHLLVTTIIITGPTATIHHERVSLSGQLLQASSSLGSAYTVMSKNTHSKLRIRRERKQEKRWYQLIMFPFELFIFIQSLTDKPSS